MKLTDHLLGRLAKLRFVVVTGKGGVGKSAMTAALGRVMSRRGRRTVLVEVDPRENLHQLLGVAPSGGEIVAAGDRLSLQHADAGQVVREIIQERLKVGALVSRLERSSIYQHFVDGVPGLKQMATLEHARRLTESGSFDLVILDAPATGHGVSLLEAPLRVAEAVDSGPFADIAKRLARFIYDPPSEADSAAGATAQNQTGVVIVTLAEEMPVDEAIELDQMLVDRLGRPAEGLIVNAVYPAVPVTIDDRLGAPAEVIDLWRRRRRINETELERLSAWTGPQVVLELLPIERGPALVDALASRLERAEGGEE